MLFFILDDHQFIRSGKTLIPPGFSEKRPDLCRLDRVADALLQQGYPAQATRLSHLAAEMRIGEAAR